MNVLKILYFGDRRRISGSRANEGARGVVGSSEGMLSKSLGYASSAMYDELSEIGFSAVTYSASGSDGGMVRSECPR